MKKALAVVVLAALVWGIGRWNHPNTGETRQSPERAQVEARAGAQLESEGTVVRVLPDDTEGSRHQRFIVRLASGRTVLIAHNIDLAPRVDGLEAGDTIAFSGQFEDNDKGGVVHWTHHDPSGRHVAGWIKYRGRVYQ
jgi:hypothetical protein